MEGLPMETGTLTREYINFMQFVKVCLAMLCLAITGSCIPNLLNDSGQGGGVILFGPLTCLFIARILWVHFKYRSLKSVPESKPTYDWKNCPQKGRQFGSSNRTSNRSRGATLFSGSLGDNINSCSDCGCEWNYGSMLRIPNHP